MQIARELEGFGLSDGPDFPYLRERASYLGKVRADFDNVKNKDCFETGEHINSESLFKRCQQVLGEHLMQADLTT
jgi:hypothetical protein